MGRQLLDQYTYLHFATGIIVYFFDISFNNWLLIHTLFEIIENTSFGITFINKYFKFWPGGKPEPDYIINRIGDTIGAIIGWISAYYLDRIGNKYGWYKQHLN